MMARLLLAGVGVTYGHFLLVFLCVPIVVLGVILRRHLTGQYVRIVGSLALIAVAYTTPWDNFIVANGVWTYDPARVWGIILGYVPLEEYLFFVLQPALAGLVLLALRTRGWAAS